MTDWPRLYAETYDAWVASAGRVKTAERWLAAHRWVFGPALFLIGIAIGHFL